MRPRPAAAWASLRRLAPSSTGRSRAGCTSVSPTFSKGDVCVDAKSTVVIRCILSMENELQELLRLNPRLRVSHDASMHDMYYMNQSDPVLSAGKTPRRAQVAWNDFCSRHVSRAALMQRLFNDAGYVKYEVDTLDFAARLFKLASNLQKLAAGRGDDALRRVHQGRAVQLLAGRQRLVVHRLRRMCAERRHPAVLAAQPAAQHNTPSRQAALPSSVPARRSASATRRWFCRWHACSG